MRQNRYMPFGFSMQNGERILHETEAEAVRKIFELYISGLSLQEIAHVMTAQKTPYNVDKPEWNKNMVKRILENTKYLGDGQYPTIITSDLFSNALKIRENRVGEKNTNVTPPILKDKMFCAVCGNKLHRATCIRLHYKWGCKNGDCFVNKWLVDSEIIDQITALLNLAIANPESIEIPIAEPQTISLEVTRLQNEINREMDKRDCDESKVKALILQCAAEKYNLCDDGGRERAGQRVRALFAAHEPLTDLDTALFDSTVYKVFVDGNGIVTLELQNGQVLKQKT
ncbi:MAG: recombinase family protein [Christensenellaceae bacterium]